MAYDHPDERERSLWNMVGYLGRYGHQPSDVVLRMPITAFYGLFYAVRNWVMQENDSFRNQVND